MAMAVYKGKVTVDTCAGRPDYVDITPQIRKIVEESGIKEGTVTVISKHSTCSVFFEEWDHDVAPNGESFLQMDLDDGLEKIFPEQKDWRYYRYPGLKHFEEVETWPDVEAYLPGGDRTLLWNCDAHLRSTLIGSNAVFEVADGKLVMGVTGYIFLVDYDRTRERTRTAQVVVMGE